MGTELNGDCRYECLMESTCVSVNIGPPNETGFRLCQLIDSDHTQHRDDNEARKGFIHWATEVGFHITIQSSWVNPDIIGRVYLLIGVFISNQNPCSSNPCLHNATCLNGYTDKRYICLCPVPYKGENCEKGHSSIFFNVPKILHPACGQGFISLNCFLCLDKNECADNTHDCSAKAVCKKTEGSFMCSCKEGYQGDGRNCTGEIYRYLWRHQIIYIIVTMVMYFYSAISIDSWRFKTFGGIWLDCIKQFTIFWRNSLQMPPFSELRPDHNTGSNVLYSLR